MGLCHVSKGAKVTDEDLSRCVGEFNQREDSPQMFLLRWVLMSGNGYTSR
jgi:hypothetical protein